MKKLTKKQRHEIYKKAYLIKNDFYRYTDLISSGLCILFRAAMDKDSEDFMFYETPKHLPELKIFLDELEKLNTTENETNSIREVITLLCIEMTA